MMFYAEESRYRNSYYQRSGVYVERYQSYVKPQNIDDAERLYYMERKLIFEYEEKRLITTKYAKKLRQNVNNLENYSLKEAPYPTV